MPSDAAHSNSPASPSAEPSASHAGFDPALLEILVCPLTRSPLRREGDELVAERPEGAGLRYPIREGIPVLLAEQARLPAGVADLEAFKAKYAEEIASEL